MNWTALGAIAELAGAAAVLVTLVYLAYQLRENTRAVRGQSADSALAAVLEFTGDMARDDELNQLFTRGTEDWNGLTESDRARLAYMLFRFFKITENIHYYHTLGSLDDESWAGWREVTANYARSDAGRRYLEARRHWYSARFMAFVDSLPDAGRVPTEALVKDE